MGRIKCVVAGLIAGIVIGLSLTVFAEYINIGINQVGVYVNSVKMKGDILTYKDTTYVSLREIADMLHKDTFWSQDLQTISVIDRAPKAEYTVRGYEFSSVNIKSDSYYTRVEGEIRNMNTRTRAQVVFTVNFYDADNKLVGTANAVVDNVIRGEKRSFRAYGDPVKKYVSYTIQIDSEVF